MPDAGSCDTAQRDGRRRAPAARADCKRTRRKDTSCRARSTRSASTPSASSWPNAAAGSWRAPSSRRSARSSPRSGRSPWTRPRATAASARVSWTSSDSAPGGTASSACARSRTGPAYFSRMGFSIVPHLWLAEKVFADCVKCPLFRRCGQYAMLMDLDHASDTAERESSVTLRHGMTVSHPRDPGRRRHDAKGFPRGRRQRRHQGRAASTWRCSSPIGRRPRRRCSRRTGRRRRPSSSRASTCTARAAWRERSSSTAAARTPAPATPAWQAARDMADARRPTLVGCPVEQVLVASTGVIGVGSGRREDPPAPARRDRRARRRPGRGGRTRHHDDRSVPQGGGGARLDRRARGRRSAAWRRARA